MRIRSLRRARSALLPTVIATFAAGIMPSAASAGIADTDVSLTAPADVFVFGGDSASFDAQAIDAKGWPVHLQAPSLPPGAIFTDLGNGAGTFRWLTSSVGTPTISSIVVIATNDQGAADTTTTRIHLQPRAFLGIVSEAGDPVGRGVSDTLASPLTMFTLLPPQPNLGERLEWNLGNKDWSFSFVTPFGRTLSEGSYENARRAPFQAPPQPGLGVTGNATGCNRSSGRFVIRRLTRLNGVLSGIWATLESRCDGATGRLIAEMRYNIDTTLYVTAPADLSVEPGDSVRFDVAAIETRGRPVTISVLELPVDATFTPSGSGAGTFRWRAPGAPNDNVIMRYCATNDEGVADTLTTWIHVLTPARFVTTSSLDDCRLRGQTIANTELDSEFRTLPTDSAQANARVSVGGGGTHWVELIAPPGFALRAGKYPSVQSAYYPSPADLPRLGIGFDSYGQGLGSGSFHVRKLKVGSNQRPSSLWVTFRGGCGRTPTLEGALIFNADTTLYTEAPAFIQVERGQPVQFGITAVQAHGVPTQIACPESPAGSEFAVLSGGSAVLSWPVATPVGTTAATFISSEAVGHADTVRTMIRVLEPRLLRAEVGLGDYRAAAGSYRFDAAAGTHALSPTSLGLTYQFVGWDQAWDIQMGAPFARTLTPGRYAGAAYPGWVTPKMNSKLALTVNGLYCASSGQSFHVRKIARAGNGAITKLWATFESYCQPSSIVGEVRFGEPDTTLYLTAPADLFADPAAPVGFTVVSTHAFARPVALTARGLPNGASFQDHGDGTGSFNWATPVVGGTDYAVTFLAGDDQGRQDSCVTVVHVVVPAMLETVSPQYEPIGRGLNTSFTATSAEFTLRPYLTNGAQIEVTTPLENWRLYFGAPLDQRLVPGEYTDAVGLWDVIGAHPVVYVMHNTYECRWGTLGRFTVLDASYGADGKIEHFWATFEQRCSSFAPALTGAVKYGTAFGPVATLVSRVLVSGRDGVARLRWEVTLTGHAALAIERRDLEAPEWRTVAVLNPDGEGYVTFMDREVRPGRTYDYRLRESRPDASVLDELTLTIESVGPFTIRSLGPNPTSGALVVRFGGRPTEAVEVTVADVAGRFVMQERLRLDASAEPGATIRLPHTLSAGVYTLRARSDIEVVDRRFVVIR